MQDAVGLEALQQRIAVPRLQGVGHVVGPWRVGVPHHAQAEEGGHDGQAQAAVTLDEVLDRGEHSVARPALPRRRPPVGQPTRAHPGLAGEQVAALDRRLAVLGGDQVRGEVVVAAPVRPADVVEEQQRQCRALRALADDAQLLADGEVVVVTVDDRGVGQRDRLERLVARRTHQLEVGPALVEGDELLLRRGVDGPHARAARRRPVEQEPGQVARIGPDLDDGLGLRRVQAGDQHLGVVEQRRAPVSWFVRVGVEVECEPAHEGAAVYRRPPPHARAGVSADAMTRKPGRERSAARRWPPQRPLRSAGSRPRNA